MRLNPRKCFTMHVSFANNVPPLPDVMIGDTAFTLGVTIRHDLKSSRHVVEMIKKSKYETPLPASSKGLPDVSQ